MNALDNLYRQIIMDHYKNPRNKGLFDDVRYKSEHYRNPSCGDDITIQTLLEDDHVKDVRHEGSGCSICCSSASVLSTLVKEKSVTRAHEIVDAYLAMLQEKPFDETLLEDAVAYQGVSAFPARLKCASIAWQAFKATISNNEDGYDEG